MTEKKKRGVGVGWAWTVCRFKEGEGGHGKWQKRERGGGGVDNPMHTLCSVFMSFSHARLLQLLFHPKLLNCYEKMDHLPFRLTMFQKNTDIGKLILQRLVSTERSYILKTNL